MEFGIGVENKYYRNARGGNKSLRGGGGHVMIVNIIITISN